LLRALTALLEPVAALAVARGLSIAPVQELLKRSFVAAARGVHGDAPRAVSRISTTTGIHRREVARLLQAPADAPPPQRSLASELFAHWTTDPAYRDADGPRVLPRTGAAPSFESLAQAITRDVHPRSLLDELCRVGVAAWDLDADSVALSAAAFVPRGDRARMLGFVGDNVGDHARAAVANVLAGSGRHFEQALFAGELSAPAVDWARQQVALQWQALIAAMVPALEQRIEDDTRQGLAQPHRLRVGLYCFDTAPGPDAAAVASKPAPAPRRPRAKKGTSG
jgi:hypothetical protein